MRHLFPISFLIFFLTIYSGFSANRYWISGVASNWNNTANWSATNGGPGGASVPLDSDDVFFNNNGLGDCLVDVDVTIDAINISSSYTGTIDINGNSFNIIGSVNNEFAGGTINDTPGTSSITINSTARTRFSGTTFGAIVNATSARVFLNGSTFNSVTTIEKNGGSNDDSNGGNTFAANTTITNSGSARMLLGNGSSDDFQADLTIINSGSSYTRLASNSAGNTVGGNLTVTNSGDGNTYTQINYEASSTLVISGNVTLNNTGTGSQSRIYLDRDGTVSIGGDLTINNNSAATTARMYIANRTTSQLTVTGTTTVINDGTTTNSQIYLGNNGDITFNGVLNITNNSSANNSRIYCNYDDNSTNTYNENIIVESTNANSDGISFGESNGVGTLAATKTITIGGGGFISGDLQFRNFTQTGNTAQNLTCTGTARIYNYDSNWGGDVRFIAPRNLTRGTTYNRTAYLEKTGAGNDYGAGGNTFVMDVDFVNSGSGYFILGNGTFDDYQANVSLLNSGTSTMYFARNGAGHSVAGNLNVTNSASGTNTYIYIGDNNSVTLDIAGTTTLLNNSSSDNSRIYFGNRGDITCNNNVTVTNNASGTASYLYVGNYANVTINGDLDINNTLSNTTSNVYVANYAASTVQISGATTVSNSGAGTTAQTFLGNQGDITFNGTLSIANSSSATNSQVYCNYNDNSSNTYNENIIVECTDANCDGILFGNSNGTSTLAATKTITIGGGGFIAGDLEFRNFTQTGNTAHTLTCTGTARIYNYDSNWGGDVRFIAPCNLTRGTTYNRTAYIEKTGDSNDESAGGNTFSMNVDFVNSGSGYLRLGNGTSDTCSANVTLTNSGTNNIYFAYNGAGHSVGGNLIATNSATGTNNGIYIGTGSSSTLSVNGNVSLTQNGTATTLYTYLGDQGDITVNGTLTLTNSGTGTTSEMRIANNTNSAVTIAGATTITNNNTAATTNRMYIGNQGDVTFNGTLDLINNAGATNSEIFCNYNTNSTNLYNQNITVQSTNANCDGIRFGQNGGAGTLADTKTITIGSNGFIAGYLYFGNFTQTGSTAQTLHPTGSTIFYNYNSEWNGNVNFVSPRLYTRGTTYNGTAYLEKNGAANDASTGGNTFNAEATLVSNGTGYFRPAGGTANDFNADVNYIKSNSGNLYPTYNCASTYAGNINIDFNAQVYFGASGNGRVIMDGTNAQSINDLGTSPLPLFRDFQTNNPNSEITLNTPIEIVRELDLDAGNIITSTANLLTMRDNSTVSSVSNDAYIDGPIEKIGNDAFTFPVGNDGFYAAISMSAPSGTTRRFRAQYFHQDADNAGDRNSLAASLNHISSSEYWTLERTSGTSNVTVSLSWENARSGEVNKLTTLRVAHWDGSLWTDEGNGSTTGDTISGTVVTSAAVTSFSPFTLASTTSDNPLPITLLNFDAVLNGDQVDLKWETAAEINNDYFTVERSSDGVNFEPIGRIDGKGNYNGLSEYIMTDFNPLQGVSYYRLKQTDFDGKFEYSDIISITYSLNTPAINSNMRLYPNPANNGSDVKLEMTGMPVDKEVLVVVSNVLGQQMYSKVILTDNNGNIIYAVDPYNQLPAGTYIIVASSNDTLLSKRLIIQ